MPFFLQAHGTANDEAEPSRLFVASASHDDEQFRIPARQWIEHWSDVDDTPWELEIAILEGHTHMSAPPASFRQGMRWLFSPEE